MKLHHVGLSVNDLGTSRKWYEENFDLVEEQYFEMKQPEVRAVILAGKNGLRVELIDLNNSKREREYTDPLDASSVQGYGHLAIEVDHLDGVFKSLVEHGARTVSEPSPAVQKGAFFAYVKDPEGNLIELIQPPKF